MSGLFGHSFKLFFFHSKSRKTVAYPICVIQSALDVKRLSVNCCRAAVEEMTACIISTLSSCWRRADFSSLHSMKTRSRRRGGANRRLTINQTAWWQAEDTLRQKYWRWMCGKDLCGDMWSYFSSPFSLLIWGQTAPWWPSLVHDGTCSSTSPTSTQMNLQVRPTGERRRDWRQWLSSISTLTVGKKDGKVILGSEK